MNTLFRLIASVMWLTLVAVSCVVAVMGWAYGIGYGLFFTAVFAVTLGGYIFQCPQPIKSYQALSPRALVLGIVSVVIGVAVGGFVGGLISAWLCIWLALGVYPPWGEIPMGARDASLLVQLATVLGAIVGGGLGGRGLYRLVGRKMAAPKSQGVECENDAVPGPEPEEVISEYVRWKQQHASFIEREDRQQQTPATPDIGQPRS